MIPRRRAPPRAELAGTILFVEDDCQARELVSQDLARLGYAVETVESAEAALALVAVRSFDLVIADERLGAIDGVRLGVLIAAFDELLPVIDVGISIVDSTGMALDDAPGRDTSGAHRYYRVDAIPTDSPPGCRPRDSPRAATNEHLPSLEEVERRHIIRALRAMHGDRTLTAKLLGVDRRTLCRRIDRLNIAL